MQLQGEKHNGKNKENSTDVTLNIDTDFMFYFLILQKYSKIKFLTFLPSKFLTIMYIMIITIIYIRLFFEKKISLTRFCQCSKSRRNQSVDW